MLSKGDYVQVLDENEEGVVINIIGDEVTIESKDGFVLTYKPNELLKIDKEDEVDIRSASTRSSVSEALQDKADPKKRSFTKEKRSRKDEFILEVDLHIEKLTNDYRRMEKHDMLNLQLDTARGQLEFAIRNRIPRIVFIHGVGEGVLKAELEFLFSRYAEVVAEDANYQKYGLGATQIYIKQNPNR
ncbi:DNA mismatch repair protein MutS [Myroides marinus]|uniref:Smr domain-containing protein n=1 Tax=Myroides marinus TaxID=703342 RepID=A0A1H6V020_9FLAO|nr:DNA mismatch repair protein MutS [Myroides marinus]MDM1369821.1 DNA mismatch repair protein MutS [Myroides marinus]MDM1379405.1 DNA mismatch repair protein MutS [Myroides marinus]MDM1384060.1 DNA mismatch repair protein MutS [Myroides marinus]MDM1386653.1 DNA mismatch repair protein MutS [Myroides marinus]MDM1393866.1 DNA mismatch repair protein MutS [Myroides marinus]